VDLEWGPLSLVKITEKLFQGNSGSNLENRNNDCGGFVALTTRHPLSVKLALTSPTSGGRSVGIVRACGLKPRSYFFVCSIVTAILT
jgi:hypothetical protein